MRNEQFHLITALWELLKNLNEEIRIRGCFLSPKNLSLAPSPPLCRNQNTMTRFLKSCSSSLSEKGWGRALRALFPVPGTVFGALCIWSHFIPTTILECQVPFLQMRKLRFTVLTLGRPSFVFLTKREKVRSHRVPKEPWHNLNHFYHLSYLNSLCTLVVFILWTEAPNASQNWFIS